MKPRRKKAALDGFLDTFFDHLFFPKVDSIFSLQENLNEVPALVSCSRKKAWYDSKSLKDKVWSSALSITPRASCVSLLLNSSISFSASQIIWLPIIEYLVVFGTGCIHRFVWCLVNRLKSSLPHEFLFSPWTSFWVSSLIHLLVFQPQPFLLTSTPFDDIYQTMLWNRWLSANKAKLISRIRWFLPLRKLKWEQNCCSCTDVNNKCLH